jgi:thiol:disulfide interchange protein DsbG
MTFTSRFSAHPALSRRWLLTAAAASCVALVACKDAPSPGEPAKAASSTVSIAEVAAGATGFSAGSAMSARTVYVFFDPQCPHCSDLWRAATPLVSQARFVWIPVGLLNDTSRSQGAALLAAADPVAAMNLHEASMGDGKGGIGASADAQTQLEAVAKNTALFNKFGFNSIPTVVGTHAQTGALVTNEGSMPTAALATLLGLQAPSV